MYFSGRSRHGACNDDPRGIPFHPLLHCDSCHFFGRCTQGQRFPAHWPAGALRRVILVILETDASDERTVGVASSVDRGRSSGLFRRSL